MTGLIDFSVVNPDLANPIKQRLAKEQQQYNNEILKLNLQNAQQDMADRQALRNAKPDDLLNNPMAYGKQGVEYAKSIKDLHTAKINTAKATVEAMKDIATRIAANPDVNAAISETTNFGKVSGVDVSNELAQLQQIGNNPNAIKAWAIGHSVKAESLLPKFQHFDNGSAIVTGTIDPITGEFKQGTSYKKQVTPDELLRSKDRQAALEISKEKISKMGNNLSPDEYSLISNAVNDGRIAPSKLNSRNAKIVASVLALNPNADLKAMDLDNITKQSAARATGTTAGNVSIAANEATQMIPVVKDYISKINPSDYPLVNKVGLYIAKNSGDPNQAGLAASLNALVNTYARAINPKGVPTVSDKNHARDIISSSMSSGQFNEVLSVMQKEMDIARNSAVKTKATNLEGDISNVTPSKGWGKAEKVE